MRVLLPLLSVSMPTEGEVLQDWVFGVRWTPESFLQQAVSVGHPFKNFSGLSDDVRAACEFAASAAHEQVVELRCKKLGSWLQKVRALESEEKLLKEKMPSGKASHTGVQAYCFYETCHPGGGLR